jgi:hypothetical protein
MNYRMMISGQLTPLVQIALEYQDYSRKTPQYPDKHACVGFRKACAMAIHITDHPAYFRNNRMLGDDLDFL